MVIATPAADRLPALHRNIEQHRHARDVPERRHTAEGIADEPQDGRGVGELNLLLADLEAPRQGRPIHTQLQVGAPSESLYNQLYRCDIDCPPRPAP